MSLPSRSPTLSEVLAIWCARTAKELRVALPARVERYDASRQTVDVAPLLKETSAGEDGEDVTEPLPVLSGVPVVFPGGGGFRLTMPIAAGDVVLIVFSDRSLDRWKAQGGAIDPVDLRMHALSDAIAIPGLHAPAAPLSDAPGGRATFGSDTGLQVSVGPAEIELGRTPLLPATDAAVLGDTYRLAEDVMLTAVAAFLNAVVAGPIPAPTAVLAQTAGAAINAFKAAAATYLSSKVKLG